VSRELGTDEPPLPVRRLIVGIVGILLVVTGVAALWQTVYLDTYDHWGIQIGCGSVFSTDLFQIGLAERQGVDFVAQCGNALQARRVWAIPVLVSGWLLLTGVWFMWWRTQADQDTEENPSV